MLDLAPLSGRPLEHLAVQRTSVADVPPLRGMSGLRSLDIQGTRVANLTPLRGIGLEQLRVDVEPRRGQELLRAFKTLKTLHTGDPAPTFEVWPRQTLE